MEYRPLTMLALLNAIRGRYRKLTDGELVDVAMAIDSGSIAHLSDPQLMEVAAIAQTIEDPILLTQPVAMGLTAPSRLPRPLFLDIAVRWADRALEVLRSTGFGFSAETAAIRSSVSIAPSNVLTFVPSSESALGPTLRIAKRSGQRFDLFVDNLPDCAASSGPRITLRRGDKEVSSLIWNGDSIRFANIGIGSYSVEVDPCPADFRGVSVTLTSQ